MAEQSCWWYFSGAIWPSAEFHRHTLNYSLLLLKAAQDCSWRCTASIMRETDTIHWVGPLQVVLIAKYREDNAEKGLYTGRVRILQIASRRQLSTTAFLKLTYAACVKEFFISFSPGVCNSVITHCTYTFTIAYNVSLCKFLQQGDNYWGRAPSGGVGCSCVKEPPTVI